MKLFDINNNKTEINNVAVEELNDGKAFNETELRFICKIKDYSYFDTLTYEDHEQYQYKSIQNNFNVVERIRKTNYGIEPINGCGKESINRTTKSSSYASDNNESNDRQIVRSNLEICISTTQDGFNQFKSFCKEGMIKRRYFSQPFKLTDTCVELVIEYDLTPIKDGFSDWCRVEIEIPKELINAKVAWGAIIKDKSNNCFLQIINQSSDNLDDRKLIDDLYQNVFITKL